MATSFVFEFQYSAAFVSAWQSPVLYRIEGDYEECSTVAVARYIMTRNENIFCYPMRGSRYVFLTSSISPQLARQVQCDMGIHLRINCTSAAASAQDEVLGGECVVFSMHQATLFAFYHHCLSSGKFLTIASVHLEHCEYYELQFGYRVSSPVGFLVYGFERCVLNGPETGLIYFQLKFFRLKDIESWIHSTAVDMNRAPDLDLDLFEEIDLKQDSHEFSSSTLPKTSILDTYSPTVTLNENLTGILLPTGESVKILEIVEARRSSQFFDMMWESRCRSLGYRQYVPRNITAFQIYWTCAYGIKFPDDFQYSDCHIVRIRDETYERLVPVDSLIRSIAESIKLSENSGGQAIETISDALRGSLIATQVESPITTSLMQERHKKIVLDEYCARSIAVDIATSSLFINAANASRERKRVQYKDTDQLNMIESDVASVPCAPVQSSSNSEVKKGKKRAILRGVHFNNSLKASS